MNTLRSRAWLLLLGCGLCFGCKRELPAAGKASAGSGSALTTATKKAPDARAPAKAAEVDLLQRTRSIVWVSSWVGQEAYGPEKLVDGKLDTAWNGRAKKLVGSEIGFIVPPAATVSRIEITAGFTATSPKLGDLFDKNHRITKVEIRHGGESLGEHELDPQKRALQSIALPAGTKGGRFVIRVAAVVPGSKPKWKEICVSELRVLGSAPPATLRAAKAPTVLLGAPPPLGPGERLCEAPAPAKAKKIHKVGKRWLLSALLPGYDAKRRSLGLTHGYVVACNGARQKADWKEHHKYRSGAVVQHARKKLADGRLLLWYQVGRRPLKRGVAGDYDPHGFIAIARLDEARRRIVLDSVGAWASGDGVDASILGRVAGKLLISESVHMEGTGGGGSEYSGVMLSVEVGDTIHMAYDLPTGGGTSSMGGDPCEYDGTWSSKLEVKGNLLLQHVKYSKRRQGGRRCKKGKNRDRGRYTRTFELKAGKLVERPPKHDDTPM